MVDETNSEPSVGLSDEETEDIQKLIRAFKAEQAVSPPDSTLEKVQDQVRSINKRLMQLSKTVLELNSGMKALYDIVRLSQKKSEMMNERIDAIVRFIKDKENH